MRAWRVELDYWVRTKRFSRWAQRITCAYVVVAEDVDSAETIARKASPPERTLAIELRMVSALKSPTRIMTHYRESIRMSAAFSSAASGSQTQARSDEPKSSGDETNPETICAPREKK